MLLMNWKAYCCHSSNWSFNQLDSQSFRRCNCVRIRRLHETYLTLKRISRRWRQCSPCEWVTSIFEISLFTKDFAKPIMFFNESILPLCTNRIRPTDYSGYSSAFSPFTVILSQYLVRKHNMQDAVLIHNWRKVMHFIHMHICPTKQ